MAIINGKRTYVARSLSREDQRAAVALVVKEKASVEQVAKSLNINTKTLRRWIKREQQALPLRPAPAEPSKDTHMPRDIGVDQAAIEAKFKEYADALVEATQELNAQQDEIDTLKQAQADLAREYNELLQLNENLRREIEPLKRDAGLWHDELARRAAIHLRETEKMADAGLVGWREAVRRRRGAHGGNV